MNLAKSRNQYGELITLDQACGLANLGKTKIREIANEARAVVKIGRAYRINKEKLFDYICKTYSV